MKDHRVMKSNNVIKVTTVILALVFAHITAYSQGPGRGRGQGQGAGRGQGAGQGQGQGHGRMHQDAMKTIHGLFDSHDKFKREVKQTKQGYISKTTSTDPAMAKLIQTHVKQMEKRLKAGLMVRRWDPAYREFVDHYDDIEIKITNIKGGISIVATGKTEAARKVARNHAGIISKFVKRGWDEHDVRHPAVLSSTAKGRGNGPYGKGYSSGGPGAKNGKPCCEAEAKGKGGTCDKCSKPQKK